MPSLVQALAGHFVVANLGAAGDADYDLPPHLLNATTLVEIEAGNKLSTSSAQYFRKFTLTTPVAGSRGKRRFFNRKYWGCSSLHEPDERLVRKYGLEEYFELLSVIDVETGTLPDILQQKGIPFVDFLKTDLEGEDFAVIRNCVESMNSISAIKCELRFEPFYLGEPSIIEVAGFLIGHGFEIIALKPEYWKPATPHQKKQRDGRIVFADCLFMKKPEVVENLPDGHKTLAMAKQVLIASMVGKRGHAEWLLERYGEMLPKEWVNDISAIVKPNDRLERVRDFKEGVKKILEAVSLWPIVCAMIAPSARESETFPFSHLADTRDNL